MSILERWDADCWRHAEDKADGDRIEVFIQAVGRNAEIPGIVQLYLAFAIEAANPEHPAHEYFHARFSRIQIGLGDAVKERQRSGHLASSMLPSSLAQRLIAVADGLQLQALLTPNIDVVQQLRQTLDEVSTDTLVKK